MFTFGSFKMGTIASPSLNRGDVRIIPECGGGRRMNPCTLDSDCIVIAMRVVAQIVIQALTVREEVRGSGRSTE